MAVYTLNGLPLDHMQWVDQHSWQPGTQIIGRTLSGTLVAWGGSLDAGRPVTLVIQEGSSWLTLAEATAIKELAVNPGDTYPLVWNDEEFTVMFRYDEPPAIQLDAIAPGVDMFTGTIKLITI